MSLNMDDMSWHQTAFGIAALKKMGDIPENFRIYFAGWKGEYPNYHGMEVTGAEFKRMKRKTTHGVKIKGTERTVYISKAEIQQEDK